MGSHWIPLLNFHDVAALSFYKKHLVRHVMVNFLMSSDKEGEILVWNVWISWVSVCQCCSPQGLAIVWLPLIAEGRGQNRWQTVVAYVSVFQGRWAASIRTPHHHHPPTHPLSCHVVTNVCFVDTQKNKVMTHFPASPSDSHTFGRRQWTKLSPGLLWVTGELTFGLWSKQAHDRLVCGPPPGFHLCDPLYPLLTPKPTPCFSFVCTLSTPKITQQPTEVKSKQISKCIKSSQQSLLYIF